MAGDPVIAIVGCGRVGARHVEATGRLRAAAAVYAVDPSSEATSRAAQLFVAMSSATGSPARLTTARSVDELPARVDVAVIATQARDRLAAIDRLLSVRSVGHLVLEKFLFARRSDYERAEPILARLVGSAWVNCPRRLYPGYRELKERCAGADFVRIDVVGGSDIVPIGGIGIHFSDLLDFLLDSPGEEPDIRLEGARLVPTKRGSPDFAGTLVLRHGSSMSLRLDSLAGSDAPPVVSVYAPEFSCFIEEHDQKATLATREGAWHSRGVDFPVPVQSTLTNQVIEQLLDEGTCRLTPYPVGAAIHLRLFDTLLRAYRELQADPSLEELPLT
jgi:predicted dehydrogenase